MDFEKEERDEEMEEELDTEDVDYAEELDD